MSKFLTIIVAVLFSTCVLAVDKQGNDILILHASPNEQSEAVSQIPVGAPIIPVIRQGEWAKVADPKTGAVGWIPSSTLEQSPLVMTQVIAGNTEYCRNNNCQVSFYSHAQPLSAQENAELFKKVQAQEQYMMAQQMAMQKRMSEFMADMNALMAKSWFHPADDSASHDESADEQPAKPAAKKKIWQFWRK
jgi:hypothetical protein